MSLVMKPTHNLRTHFGNGRVDEGCMTGTGEIVAVNVRYGFRGRPVLQIKRAHYRSEGIWPQPNRQWERSIGTNFRDAKRDDIPELHEFLSKCNEPVS